MSEQANPLLVQLVTTTDTVESAAKIARSSVEARLAACAQVDGPVESVYWWEGTVESAREWRVTLKTTPERAPALVEHVKAEHSYDVPEVLVTPVVGGNDAYLDWVRTETEPRD